ncbi:MAG: glycosyltransferase family 39 protein, partial [Planctomycetes bacterium]|nr:glycosyltransferase family 39 protein [Planctomycetota bacterium]
MHDDPGSAAGDRPQQPDGARDLWFLLFGVVLLAVGIWSESGISGQDEYWLSFRTVLEMQERGEWLTPYVDGAVRLQKPPLLSWLMLVNFELCGPSFFAARIWCALAGAGLAFATLKIHRLFGGRGYLAGLLVLAAAGVAVDSRRAMFDLPVGCLVTIAIWTTLRWGRSGRLSWLLGSAVALAAAALTKGPVALLFFAVPFVAALPVFRRPSRALPWRHLLPALALFLALALPWPLWVAWRWPEFWNVMNEQADSREFGFAGIGRLGGLIGACLGLVVPWSAMLLGSVLGLVRGRGERRAERWWWLGWCVLGALPFAFMKTFERYMLALVCPMALLVAAWLPTLAPRHQRAHLTVAAALLTLPAVLFAAFDLWFGL